MGNIRRSYGGYLPKEHRRGRLCHRSCLRCDRGFWAEGKYNRICPICTNVIKVAKLNVGGYFQNAIYYETGLDRIARKPRAERA